MVEGKQIKDVKVRPLLRKNPREDRGSHISPLPLNHICFQCSSDRKHLDASASLPLKTWPRRASEWDRWFPRSNSLGNTLRNNPAMYGIFLVDPTFCSNPPLLLVFIGPPDQQLPNLLLRCSPLQLFTLTCSPVQPRLFFYSTSLTCPGETRRSILLFNLDSRMFFCSNTSIHFSSFTWPPVPTPPPFLFNLFSSSLANLFL